VVRAETVSLAAVLEQIFGGSSIVKILKSAVVDLASEQYLIVR
jgi:hypothetical protein